MTIPHFLCASFIAITIMAAPAVHAEDPHHSQGIIDHYDAVAPTTTEETIRQYYMSLGAIGYMLAGHEISVQKLEDVHQETYMLEAAVEAFDTTRVRPANLPIAELRAQVEALHKASEAHDAGKTKHWFDRLKHIFITVE